MKTKMLFFIGLFFGVFLFILTNTFVSITYHDAYFALSVFAIGGSLLGLYITRNSTSSIFHSTTYDTLKEQTYFFTIITNIIIMLCFAFIFLFLKWWVPSIVLFIFLYLQPIILYFYQQYLDKEVFDEFDK